MSHHTLLARALVEHAPLFPGGETHLKTVLEQAVGHPGRLVRAQLVYAAACHHGLESPGAARLATAVEYFHLASLLLDDLPCMDNATERRGRICPHLVHGEASVILAALALINRAYALVGFILPGFPPELRLPAQACVDACLGPAGLVGGQAADLRYGEEIPSARRVLGIALRKTGALFSLSVLLPAFLARPTLREFRDLKALCVYWGLAYQVADDLDDAAGPEDRRRPNLVHASGLAAARAQLERLSRLSGKVLRRLEASHPRWAYLAAFERQVLPALPAGRKALAA